MRLVDGRLVSSSLDVYIAMELAQEGDIFNLRHAFSTGSALLCRLALFEAISRPVAVCKYVCLHRCALVHIFLHCYACIPFCRFFVGGALFEGARGTAGARCLRMKCGR